MIKARRTQDTNTQASVLTRLFISVGEDMTSICNLYVSCRTFGGESWSADLSFQCSLKA
jgi:hypothetical protein